MLCERCGAEIEGSADPLPKPWFDYEAHTISGAHVVPSVWELLKILWHRRKRGYVSVDQIMNLLYSHKKDPPEDGITRVLMGRLRLHLNSTPYAIDTVRKDGWRLIDRDQVEVEYVKLGNLEIGVPRPMGRGRGTAGQDKYGLREMVPGQSRVVINASIEAVRAICRSATRKRLGVFKAAYDHKGQMRIWRVE